MNLSIKTSHKKFGFAQRALLTSFALLIALALVASNSNGQKGSSKDGNTSSAKGGGGSGGSGGGGGTPSPTPTPTPVNPLPTTAPAPGVILRESFGEAELWRPTGSRGTMKETYLHTSISSFWLEYPGNSNSQWIAPAQGQTWRFCGASVNPYEMFSPLQVTYSNGCVSSDATDSPTLNPSALQPFVSPAGAYEITLNGYPQGLSDKYLALGLTSSSATYSSLENSGSLVLFLKPMAPFRNTGIIYELRAGGLNGTLLASGESYFDAWNQMKLRYDPVTQTASASVNGVELGSFFQPIDTPRYVGFEGIGIADNFVVQLLN